MKATVAVVPAVLGRPFAVFGHLSEIARTFTIKKTLEIFLSISIKENSKYLCENGQRGQRSCEGTSYHSFHIFAQLTTFCIRFLQLYNVQ